MQPQLHPDRGDELSEVLKAWRVEAPLPPRFREGVWRCLAVSQDAGNAGFGFWSSLWLRWESLVRKPVGIAACLTLFTAVGIGFGLWHAQTFALQTETAWQHAYFQSVNPTSTALEP